MNYAAVPATAARWNGAATANFEAASRNSVVQALTANVENQNSIDKHKDDKEYIHTIVVVASSTDDFVFCQVN